MDKKEKLFYSILVIIAILVLVQFSVKKKLETKLYSYSQYISRKLELEYYNSQETIILTKTKEIRASLNNLKSSGFPVTDSTMAMELLNRHLKSTKVTVDSLNEDSIREFGNYNISTINLKISGDYKRVLEFLFNLERDKAYLSIKKIKLNRTGKNNAGAELLIDSVIWKNSN